MAYYLVFLNHTIPIRATTTAVNAAVGLMACNVEVATKKVIKVMSETMITAVPIARLLWLISVPYMLIGAVLI